MGRRRKLTDDEVREIRAAVSLRKSLTGKQLARRFGVSLSLIEDVAAGRTYKTRHGPEPECEQAT